MDYMHTTAIGHELYGLLGKLAILDIIIEDAITNLEWLEQMRDKLKQEATETYAKAGWDGWFRAYGYRVRLRADGVVVIENVKGEK